MINKEEIEYIKEKLRSLLDSDTLNYIEELEAKVKELEDEIVMYKDIKEIANTKITDLRKLKDASKVETENWVLRLRIKELEEREQKVKGIIQINLKPITEEKTYSANEVKGFLGNILNLYKEGEIKC